MSCCRRTHTSTHTCIIPAFCCTGAALTRMWRYRCEAVKMVINHSVKWVVLRCGRTCGQPDSEKLAWNAYVKVYSFVFLAKKRLGWANSRRYTYASALTVARYVPAPQLCCYFMLLSLYIVHYSSRSVRFYLLFHASIFDFSATSTTVTANVVQH